MRVLLMTTVTTLLATVLAVLQATTATANVEDFSYESWDSVMELSVDEDGRATGHVTETLVAKFPDFDQNKGIVRGLPLTLHGAPAAPENVTVTDENGNPSPFFIEEDGDFRAILTGTDDYVQGSQTYVISYDIPDPIFQPDDARNDEFYWDMVSVDRLQQIDAFTATVTLDETLADAFNGNAVAYVGRPGSPRTEPMSHDGQTFTIEEIALQPNETVTFALGFLADTVVQPNGRISNFVMDALPVVLGAGGLATAFSSLFAISRMKRKRRSTGRAIIAQYDVPAQMPPLMAAQLKYPQAPNPIAPEFLHLAVSGHMRIEERTKSDGTLYKKPRPVFRNLAPNTPASDRAGDPLDAAMLDAIFTTKDREVFEVPKSSSSFASRMNKIVAKARAASDDRGYFTKARSSTAKLISSIALVILAGAGVLTAVSFITGFAKDYTSVAFVFAAISVPFIVAGFMRHRVHTPKGAEAFEYLEGVELFIKVAEADRINMLQSPEGAERFSSDGVEVVKLYERLLPYAVLFGVEKEWTKVLQTRYEAEQISAPYWYPYMATRGIANFGDTVTTFTGSVASAASYTASSSSGSSGGGFAGGGGGGGFSGGR